MDIKYAYYNSSKGYKVVGGTANQFLKADGSVESLDVQNFLTKSYADNNGFIYSLGNARGTIDSYSPDIGLATNSFKPIKSGFYRPNGENGWGSMMIGVAHPSVGNGAYYSALAFSYSGSDVYLTGNDSNGVKVPNKRIQLENEVHKTSGISNDLLSTANKQLINSVNDYAYFGNPQLTTSIEGLRVELGNANVYVKDNCIFTTTYGNSQQWNDAYRFSWRTNGPSVNNQNQLIANGAQYISVGNSGNNFDGDLSNKTIEGTFANFSGYGDGTQTSKNLGFTLFAPTSVNQGIYYKTWYSTPDGSITWRRLLDSEDAKKYVPKTTMINGTAINDLANVETTYWGATRTLIIGNTGKTLNGSGNQSWSLAEIGAAPAVHTHTWSQLTGTPTSVAGYGITDAPNIGLWGGDRNSILVKDTRSTNPLPSTNLQFGVWFDFKQSSALGLTSGGQSTYASSMTFVPYADDSGNNNAAYRLVQSGENMFFQVYNKSWQTFNKLWASKDFSQTNINNWNTAFNWGNHATAGYISASNLSNYYTKNEALNQFVSKSGAETVNGTKTFTQSPVIPFATLGNHAVNLYQLNNVAAGFISINEPFSASALMMADMYNGEAEGLFDKPNNMHIAGKEGNMIKLGSHYNGSGGVVIDMGTGHMGYGGVSPTPSHNHYFNGTIRIAYGINSESSNGSDVFGGNGSLYNLPEEIALEDGNIRFRPYDRELPGTYNFYNSKSRIVKLTLPDGGEIITDDMLEFQEVTIMNISKNKAVFIVEHRGYKFPIEPRSSARYYMNEKGRIIQENMSVGNCFSY
ncbi:hypothetical protein VUJ46_07325 [Chryseobacterium sp. MYb264]|uniref:hypothetical protein n=1 Tax=Chryseobacterium sp. MYb264 TaxID=2745153 RepID=UPI002E151FBE|nr:hypothetical protein VUJ46_07325 [Chryseobacterium sp. MYb264]